MNTTLTAAHVFWFRTAAVTLWLVAVVGPIHSVFGEQPPAQSDDPPIVLSFDEGPDDLDAPFLKKKIAVDFHERPLVDAVKFIAESAGVPVRLDRIAIEEAGRLIDEPVTFSSIPAASRDRVLELLRTKTAYDEWDEDMLMRIDQILDLMLPRLKLHWFVEDGVLHVTSNLSSRRYLVNRFYDLKPFRKQGISDETLRAALKLEPAARFHERLGRRGELVVVGHVLAVRESFRAQRKLRSFLMAIANPERRRIGPYFAEETVCRDTLIRLVNVEFVETPLDDAIDILAVQANARVILDAGSIEKAGVPLNKPITLSIKDRPLRQAFDWFLTDLELAVTIQAGELLVTSARAVTEARFLQRHDTRAIAPTKETQDSLVSAVKALTSESWADYDYDTALLLPMLTLENGVLVAVTNRATHDEIAKLVEFYRQHLSVPNRQERQDMP